MSFRSCSTIPQPTARPYCRNSQPRLPPRPASRRQNSPDRNAPQRLRHRVRPRPQLRFPNRAVQQNSRHRRLHPRDKRRGSTRFRVDYPRSRARHSPRPTVSAKVCSEFWVICWDSPATGPCRRKNLKPCGRAFRAGGSARNAVSPADRKGRNIRSGLFCQSIISNIRSQSKQSFGKTC